MAYQFVSLRSAALLLTLLPMSAQAAGLKSTTEETVKALTAINIPVGDVSNGIYMKTDDNFIVILKSDGRDVQSIEYIAVVQKDRKDLDFHKANASKIMTVSLPNADEKFTKDYFGNFFANLKNYENSKLKNSFGVNSAYRSSGREVGLVTIRYSQKTGAFLFRVDAAQQQDAASTPEVGEPPKHPVATALRPTLNEALAMSVTLKTPLKKIREGEYMSTPAEYFISVNSSGQKITEFAYTGQFKAGSDENINHIVRAKLFLDFFVPGLVEGDKDNEAGQMLMDIAKSLGKPPERTFSIGHGIDVKSHYFDATGLWVLTAKPQ